MAKRYFVCTQYSPGYCATIRAEGRWIEDAEEGTEAYQELISGRAWSDAGEWVELSYSADGPYATEQEAQAVLAYNEGYSEE